MARRTFEHKSRFQNTEEIIRRLDNFTGEFSDIPANEIPKGGLREVYNCVSTGHGMDPRKGVRAVYNAVFPGASDATVTASRDAYGSFSIISGYSLTDEDVGRVIVWPDHVTTIESVATPFGGSDGCASAHDPASVYIRDKIHSYIYHPKTDVFVIHVGASIYTYDPATGTKTQMNLHGDDAITSSASTMSLMGDYVVICCAGIWKVNVSSGRYWKCNISTGGNSIWPAVGSYKRRVTYTMTRQRDISGGSRTLYQDRSTLNPTTGEAMQLIEQETGSCKRFSLCGAARAVADYIEVGAGAPIGDALSEYTRLTCGEVDPSTVVGLKGIFAVTMDGVTRDITYTASSGMSFDQLADMLQAKLRIHFPNAKCYIANNRMVFENYYPSINFVSGSSSSAITMGYLTEASSAPTGYTKVAALLKGTDGPGTLSQEKYYTYAQYRMLVPWREWKSMTHFSIYCTENVDTTTGLGADPNAFAWSMDVPMMRCIKVEKSSTVISIVSGNGEFLYSDLGQYVTFVKESPNSSNGAVYGSITGISTYGAAGVATTDFDGADGNYYVFFGTYKGAIAAIGDGSDSAKTLRLKGTATGGSFTAYRLVVAQNTAGAYNPTSAYGYDFTLSVGDPVFLKNGDIAVVTDDTNAASGIYTIDTDAYDGYTGPVSLVPMGTETWNTYHTRVRDYNSDLVINARMGTLGLRTRFWDKHPDTSIGIVTRGWFISADTAEVGQYNYVNLPENRTYVLGNNNAGHHRDRIEDAITAFSASPNILSIHTLYQTLTMQTNLGINYTDESNGTVLETLPTADYGDRHFGVRSMNHIEYSPDGVAIMVNQDYGVRTFDGFSFGKNLVHNQIQKKIQALASFAVCYDEQYGLLIFGQTTDKITQFDKLYYVSIDPQKFYGCGSFGVPYAEHLCKPQTLNNAATWVSAGIYMSGSETVLDDCIPIQFQSGDVYQDLKGDGSAYYDYPSYIITADDTGDTQLYTLRHLEGRVVMSGLTSETGNATVMDVTAYNDIGTQLTQTITVKGQPYFDTDIHFDRVLQGHRIRFKFAWSKALYRLNGYLNYYAVYDRADSITNRLSTENDLQMQLMTPVFGVGTYHQLLNLATGAPLTQSGTITRSTGPDGITGTAISFTPTSYLSGVVKSSTSTAFSIYWWQYGTTGGFHVLNATGLIVTATSNGLSITIGANTVTASLTASSTWTQLCIVKGADGGVTVYQDAVAVRSATPAEVSAAATVASELSVQIGVYVSAAPVLYDMRIVDGVVTP